MSPSGLGRRVLRAGGFRPWGHIFARHLYALARSWPLARWALRLRFVLPSRPRLSGGALPAALRPRGSRRVFSFYTCIRGDATFVFSLFFVKKGRSLRRFEGYSKKRSAPGRDTGGATKTSAEYTHTGLHRAQADTMAPCMQGRESEAARENVVTRTWALGERSCLQPLPMHFPRRLRSKELGCGRVGGTGIATAIRTLPGPPPCAVACHEALPSGESYVVRPPPRPNPPRPRVRTDRWTPSHPSRTTTASVWMAV